QPDRGVCAAPTIAAVLYRLQTVSGTCCRTSFGLPGIVAHMSNPFRVLAQARRLATGVGLDIDPPNLRPECTSEAEFNDVVRGYYGFFYERLAKDTSFLLRRQSAKEIEAFRRLLYDLRTAANHTDNPKAE